MPTKKTDAPGTPDPVEPVDAILPTSTTATGITLDTAGRLVSSTPWFARYRKLVVAAVAAVLQVLQVIVVPAQYHSVVVIFIAIATALGVHAVPNTP